MQFEVDGLLRGWMTPAKSKALALAEAESLYRLVGKDGKLSRVLRELIEVPENLKKVLREYGDSDPAETHWIENASYQASHDQFLQLAILWSM